jgi:hypothetical protein
MCTPVKRHWPPLHLMSSECFQDTIGLQSSQYSNETTMSTYFNSVKEFYN